MASLKQEEYDQYDRQIHIWGAENQKKLISSTIAFVYCDSLCVEVAKNIVLAGMNVVLYDNAIVKEGEYLSNYFLRKEDTGKKRCECIKQRLQELNPRATIQIESIQNIASSSSSIILVCNPNKSQIQWIDSLSLTIPIYCLWSSGLWGILLNTHLHHPLSTFLSSSTTSFPTTSILPLLIKALEEDAIPTPSPIAIEAVIGGIISQTIVATITGQSELKDGIEFDATTLNATEFVYCSVCLKK